MISIWEVSEALRKDTPADLLFCKLSTGQMVELKGAVCIGRDIKNDTRKFRLPNNQVREVKLWLIIRFNGQKVHL